MPHFDGPSTASRPSASRMPGKARRASLTDISARSVQPRKKPAIRPVSTPTTSAQARVDPKRVRRRQDSGDGGSQGEGAEKKTADDEVRPEPHRLTPPSRPE